MQSIKPEKKQDIKQELKDKKDKKPQDKQN